MREPIAASGTFVLPAVGACAFGTERFRFVSFIIVRERCLVSGPSGGSLGASCPVMRIHFLRLLLLAVSQLSVSP